MLIPSREEKQAADLGRGLKKLIRSTLTPIFRQKKPVRSLKTNKCNEITQLLESVKTLIEEHLQNNQQSPYFSFLLTQLSRYNTFFTQVTAIDEQRVEADHHGGHIPNNSCDDKQQIIDDLIQKGIRQLLYNIENPITSVRARVYKDDSFSPPYVVHERGKIHYYYKEKDNNYLRDYKHYEQANLKIGGATQQSNVRNIFKAGGQHSDAYYRSQDKKWHEIEQKLFRKIQQKIEEGTSLNNRELALMQSGRFYRFALAQGLLFNSDDATKIQHIGHAAELMTIAGITVAIDPINYQTGTEGIVSIGGKLLYDRQVDPAFTTTNYLGTQIVLISHNHHDHLCKKTLQEAFAGMDPIFIVPIGDGDLLRSWGFKNVIELSSWNQEIEVTVNRADGSQKILQIHSLPANHASNRSLNDLFESLYMGYLVKEKDSREYVLFSGDTAVLSEDHINELEHFLIESDCSIKSACIAHGPDRPRSWMECTHMSTADALALLAEITLINVKVKGVPPDIDDQIAEQNYSIVTLEELNQMATYGIGYHQGCYRLGILSYNDVESTVTRILSLLDVLQQTPITEAINDNFLTQYFHYHIMDNFERVGFINMLKAYQQIHIKNDGENVRPLQANEIKDLIVSHLNIPQPGFCSDFTKPQPYPHYEYDSMKLLVNRNPLASTLKQGHALEYFAYHLNPDLYMGNLDTLDGKRELIRGVLSQFVDRNGLMDMKRGVNAAVKGYLDGALDMIDTLDHLNNSLIDLYSRIHFDINGCNTHDETIRDEGHFQTVMIILFNLMHLPEFRQSLSQQHIMLRSDAECRSNYICTLTNVPTSQSMHWESSDDNPVQTEQQQQIMKQLFQQAELSEENVDQITQWIRQLNSDEANNDELMLATALLSRLDPATSVIDISEQRQRFSKAFV